MDSKYTVDINIVYTICVLLLQSTDIPDKDFILAKDMEKINRLFDGKTMEEIYQNLEKDGSEWATTQLNTLKKMVKEFEMLFLEIIYQTFSNEIFLYI